ncbi:hypothetical protein V1477_017447 [Vespula maculifrons]|uniref:Uncharacterized protein n=1 Tax=Vespula maculifrons TaxID=7453 RepID=A0ABD2B611_VESMC
MFDRNLVVPKRGWVSIGSEKEGVGEEWWLDAPASEANATGKCTVCECCESTGRSAVNFMIDRTIYSVTVLANLLPLAKNLREKLDEEEKEDEEKEEEEEEEEDEEDEEEEEEEDDDDDDEKDEMDFPLIHESFDERLVYRCPY